MATKTKYQQRTDLLFDIETIRKEQKDRLAMMLLSELQEHGFSKVTKRFDGQRKSKLTIRFEKQHEDHTCDWIEAVFCKYHGRKFQIGMGKNSTNAPYAPIRIGNLVRRKGQLYCFWGARAWLPFRDIAFARASKRVTDIVPQAIRFLETGQVGRNVHGREWTLEDLERGWLES